jgi:site-specific DNA-methyltransferase (adenine-specific)
MIIQGDNRETLKTLDDSSIDAIVTDPPYGIDFLGKAWDANTGALETYQECLRVLKPGGYLLAFSAARTYHHLAVTLERAGFEIRDQIMWLYASGFPKAQDLGKAIQKRQGVEETKTHKTLNGYAKEQTAHGAQRVGDVTKEDYENTIKETVCTSPEAQQWSGWKTALKPAHEPICMARKPFKGSTIDNVLEHGVGALNIDATRITTDDKMISSMKSESVYENFSPENRQNKDGMRDGKGNEQWQQHDQGRFPSNVLGEVEGYQKFFYCPKVSRKERHTGFETKDIPTNPEGMYNVDGTGVQYNAQKNKTNGNNHPTVKPVELMKYLIKLVTPPNSTVLDPFAGSGSTGMAAVELGHTFIGCELDPAYVEIAEARIAAWNTDGTTKKEFFE